MKEIDLVEQQQITQENKDVKDRVILNSSEVWTESPFTVCKLNQDTIGIGLLLPKNVEKENKNSNNILSQKWYPYILTNKHRIIEANNNLNTKYKISFKSIPDRLPLRWQLEDIDAFTSYKESEYLLSIKELFNLMVNEYKQQIYMQSEEWYKIHALWDIGTYFFQLFDYYPIFDLWGGQGSGKTKIMQLSKCFTLNPTEIMNNPTESSLFRETHDKRPTKYIDEAEKIWKYDYQRKEMLSDNRAELLNASWQKGSTVPRTESLGRGFKVIYYEAYSPTMLASINGLQGATKDRAIIHVCVRNPSSDKRGDISIESKRSIYIDIRNHLYRLFLEQGLNIESEYKRYSEQHNTSLSSRNLKIWQPMLVIAKLIDYDLHEQIKVFAEKQTEIKQMSSLSDHTNEHKIIKTGYQVLEHTRNSLPVKEVANRLELHSKTVTNVLDKLGLKDCKNRNNLGMYYEINIQSYQELIQQTHQNLDFATFATLSTQDKDFIEYKEETINNVSKEKNSVTNEETNRANVGNVANEESVVPIKEKEVLHDLVD